MRSTFFGLEMGRRALQAQQRALDVTGHNISNANTEGYSRQEAVLKATNPYTVPGFNKPFSPGQVGSGVDVKEIRRIRDEFNDTQVRTENKSLGYWSAKSDTLQKIEAVINEPSDDGLRSVMDKFWESWQELSKSPESVAVRSVVRQRGIAVAETINHLDKLYSDLQTDINDTIAVKVKDVNSIANQLAEINKQVLAIEGSGDNANDLRDKRDLLIDQLSKLVDVQTSENNLGVVNVRIAGSELVVDSNVSPLLITKNPANGFNDIYWSNTNLPFSPNSGEIKGLIESRDVVVPSLRTDLDNIANALVTEINAIHSGGFNLNGISGFNFFTLNPAVTSASGIKVDNNILTSLDNIAASDKGLPLDTIQVGNGENAINIAQIKQTVILGLNANIDDYYRSQIGKVGVESQEAARMVDNQNLLIDQLDQRRQAMSGVSLDEEMTNMMKFQHAYNAASKVINAFDEMLDTVINRLGAGR